MTELIRLFANCVVVKGAKRSLICDLQRRKYKLIPNSLAELFDDNGCISFTEIESRFDRESIYVFNEYIEFLNENEFVFYCTPQELHLFPKMSMEWDYPALISNMIIDVNSRSNHDFNRILRSDITKIGCRYVQFRRFDESTIEEWDQILKLINDSPIRAIDLILKDSPSNFSHDEFSAWVRKNKKIRSATIHSSNENRVVQGQHAAYNVVVAIQQRIDSNTHCGVINPGFFITNFETYTESQNHNTCLNRKVAIDVDGNIKNCPSMAASFGNIQFNTLYEGLCHPDFKSYWFISKSQVEVCQDCEFRHICTDCRAYLEKPENQFSKPLKCGYSPYTNEWENWSTNPLKQDAIKYYGM